jgi:hypothetical protein
VNLGCESCFCTGELCELVLAYVGFDDRPNELYDFYFELLDRYCEKVSHENARPIKESLEIYTELRCEWERLNFSGATSQHDTKNLLKGVGNKFRSLRTIQEKELDTVARALRITPAVLMRIERGDCNINPNLLSDLCGHYNITLSDFFEDVEANLEKI